MSALPDLPPDVAHAVVSGVWEMHQVLDRMHAGVATPLSSGSYTALVAELDRAARRLAALRLRVFAAADQAAVAADAGFAGTEAWVARQTTTSRSVAAREVGLARDLHAGGHDATSAALDRGLVSPDHAAVILRAGERLPAGVSDTQRRQVEAALLEKAGRFDPDQLRRIARRAVEAIEADPGVVDAHDNDDGTTTGRFTIATTQVAFLRTILEAMTSPRRTRAGRHHGRHHDWDHRRGLAFAELLEHLPTDHLHDRTAATVVVTIDHQVLQGALRAAHLDTGQHLSAGEARRLACTAGLVPAVLGARSVALDLGRESRLFSQAQRLAKSLEHDTCAAEGCDRPYAWCELHHRHPWSHGGRTDLRDAVPLCSWHHQRIHDPTFGHGYGDDGSVWFHRHA